MKKLLSIVLALSLCLTAMMGCFVVSAETNAITAGDVEIVAGNDAVVTFTLATEGISAAMVEIAYTDLDLKAIGYANAVGTEQLTVEFAHSAEVYDSEGNVTEDFTTANANDTIKAILNVGDIVNDKINTIDIVLTFNAPATGEYVVNVAKIEAATAGTYDATAGWTDEEALITINTDDAAANVVVIAPCDHTEVTYTDNGDGTHTSACANEACTGGFVPATEPHDYGETGTCVCGAEKVVEPEITVEFSTSMQAFLELESEVLLGVGYKFADMSINPDDYLDNLGLMIWNNGETVDTTTAIIENCEYIVEGARYSTTNNRFETISLGIPAKNLGDTLSFRPFFKNSDGTYTYGRLITGYSPKKYCYNQINGTTVEKTINLMAALLNYGTAAQNYFSWNTENPMNSELSAELQALNWDGTLVRTDYNVPADKETAIARDNSVVTARGGYLALEGAIDYAFYSKTSISTPASATIYYWTEEAYNSLETLTLANATSSEAMEWVVGNSRWEGKYEGVAPKEMFNLIYACMVYTDAEGNEYCSGVVGYSPERYAYLNQNKADERGTDVLAKRVAIYGDAARTYFAK